MVWAMPVFLRISAREIWGLGVVWRGLLVMLLHGDAGEGTAARAHCEERILLVWVDIGCI